MTLQKSHQQIKELCLSESGGTSRSLVSPGVGGWGEGDRGGIGGCSFIDLSRDLGGVGRAGRDSDKEGSEDHIFSLRARQEELQVRN